MRKCYIILFCLLTYLTLGAFAQAPTTEFIENKGQWGDWFRYRAKTLAGDIFLEDDGFRYALSDDANVAKVDSFHHGQLSEKPTLKFHVYKMVIEGGNKPEILGAKQQKHYYNYFLGNDSTKWKSGIHPYLSLEYRHIYDGIDMQVTSDNSAFVYEFYVKPGADAKKIKLRFDGIDKMFVNHKGNLVINTSVGQVTEMKPYVYQYINDEKVEVACNYHLEAHTLSFDMPDDYDHSKLLIIDPVTLWASFTGSTADNWGFTATYDDAGNFYMGGIVNCLGVGGGPGGAFPVSPGAYQVVWGGGVGTSGFQFASDYGIMKLSPDGVSRIYATYIGGSQNERPHSMIVDGAGNLIIAGRSLSPNFPVTGGAFQATKNAGWDIVVTKLNSTGTALVASTFLGGSGHDGVNFDSTEYIHAHLKYNYGDDARSEVQVDNAGNIYVAGNTQSFDFPVTSTAIASTMTGLQAGVVFKLNSTMSSLLWSTYLDGSGDDAGYVLAFNPAQTSVYVGGATNSTNFPVPSTGGWLTTYQGDSADGYILRFRNSAPYNVEAGTYVGTSHYDQVYGLQVDDAGDVYAMGLSLGGTFPVTPGVYTNPNSCQFIIKLNANLTTDLISTVYGSGDPTKTNISPVAFLVDTCNNVYVSGWGGNVMAGQPGVVGLTTVGTTIGMPIPTPLPGETIFQSTTDGADFYFIVLGSGMTTLRYATFYGRNYSAGGEHVDGGTSRFDKKGVVYQGICANCGGNPPPPPVVPPFPTTPGVWEDTSKSANCNQAALKIAFNIGPVECNITAGPSTSGCAPLTVNFVNTTTNGLTFLWNFGDGSPTVTTFAPTHTYTAGGTFTVTLTSTNENACFKTTDTAFLIISVDTNKLHPDFTYQITDSCGPFIAAFTNTSTTNITTGAPTYVWHFGDGATFAGDTPPPHNYADTGYYTVMLIMSHPDACKTPDTVQKKIHIYYTLVSAEAELPDTLCLGATFRPTGGMKNATSVNWTFGDGGTSTETLPSYKYMAPGTYTVTVVAANPGTCNGADTVVHIITVISGPIADFIFIPVKPEANIPTTFTNKSINATHYSWDFGDNTSSAEVNPVHQYKKTGNFKVCLTAMNESTCPAVACKTVPTEVVPLLGLPTGFSPNGDGQNDILYVRGAAIETMHLRIYNRWGQLVFESKSQDIGWDGTFGGEPQPIEAYGYVLEATFIDGTSRLLKGNITLLR